MLEIANLEVVYNEVILVLRGLSIQVPDGQIVALGLDLGDAEQVIDANGLTVTPGFVDIHTHLDAQIGWDPYLTPISWHGVTTALLGNCGCKVV